MDRRRVLVAAGAFAATSFFGCNIAKSVTRDPVAPLSTPGRRFDLLYRKLLSNPKWLGATRGVREREREEIEDPLAPRRLLGRPPLSSTPIAARAVDLIIAFEVTSQSAYTRLYQRPTWPKGASGVTIGVGYDIGYATKSWLREDWSNEITDALIQRFEAACGVTGEPAHTMVFDLRDILISWPIAKDQFLKRILPRTVGETERALPNTNLLSGACLGALTSLVYNRGASFDSPKDRYREMRAIKAHMEAQAFSNIPGEFRAMKRLWEGDPDMRGLLQRRELEALLFEDGLRISPARFRSKKLS
jgi:GH24 family phage-related lysozyme (muramidase)